ncbi:hypothetical protein [Micromonospora sp. WMMD1155]|uniref:hypothetical protein n=1 Tax=Micromonospora sp. WMMD1155 TaxID=3016094 RepID=UPI00249A9B16|nr:hypothetical protein [Micromonospora sp. WMMD1155]WFE53835.1 hypothetical protein O7617_27425 [Micromonospora sp. WMMD1155]
MSEGAVRRWPSAVGAWLGIGTAPATLVLGAAMAARHGGAVPVAGLLVRGALLAVACTLAGVGVAPLLGLALAGVCTVLWRRRGAR